MESEELKEPVQTPEEPAEEREPVKISVTGPVVRAAASGIAAGVVILLLFGLLSHRWVIAVLAGFCVCVGVFAMVFTFCYFKAAESWYKAHPQPRSDEEEGDQDRQIDN